MQQWNKSQDLQKSRAQMQNNFIPQWAENRRDF